MLIGEAVVTGRKFASVDPSSPTRVVAHAHEATAQHVRDAIAQRGEGPQGLVAQARPDRAAALSRAAGILRTRRLELTALAVREAGKPWAEADADVCEAIDFLEYYAAARWRSAAAALISCRARATRCATSAAAYGRDRAVELPAGDRRGMVGAALATGNAVVLKPAEQTPACAKAVVDALHAGGVPLDALASSPAATRRARRWSPTRASTRSPSPAPAPSACRSSSSGEGRPRPAPHQAGDRRDGRQERDHRRLRRRPRRRRPGVLKSAFGFAGQKCSAAPARSCTPRSPTRWPSGWRRGHDAAGRPGRRTSPPTCRR